MNLKNYKRIRKLVNGRVTTMYKLKNKNKKMSSLKKYLNHFIWYDLPNEELLKIIPLPVMGVEYPSNFETHFGKIPTIFLKITDKILPIEKFQKFQKYLLSQGFHLMECGHETFKYIHFERKILINGDATDTLVVEDEEDEDGYSGHNSIDSETIFINLLPTLDNKNFIEKVMKKINTFLVDVSTQIDKFYVIAQGQHGLFTQKTKFKSIPVEDDRFDLFYGEKFPHEKMQRFVWDKTDNLMLLHGDPGTGKSNYIKHLITSSKKKVIYIPPSMLSVISDPGFVTFMMDNKDSILLIEDAEEVLSIDRNSATNNLLGLTDGFLKDALGLKVIATFNCDIGKIDPALKRKGRMYFEYKFDKLTVDECRTLAKHLKLDKDIKDPMTLAEFFNTEDNTIEDSFTERFIGFAT